MAYRGRHRQPVSRAKLRVAVLAAAVGSGSLVVPIAAPPAANGAVVYFTDYERAEWLNTPDITINPPGPKPGEAVAPPVERGYVITGDHLARFNITATPAGQQELQAFVKSIQHYQGITVDASTYSVFATPPILQVSYTHVAKMAAALVTLAQNVAARYTDPAELALLLDQLMEEMPTIAYDLPDTENLVDLASAVIRLAVNMLMKQVPEIRHEHGFLPDGADIETVMGLANGVLGLVSDPPVEEQPTPDELAAQVTQQVAQLTASLDALLISLGFGGVEEMAGDPAHAAPIGTDPVTDALDGTLGDVVILPIGTSVGEVSAAWHDNMLMVTTVVEDTPLSPIAPVINTGKEAGPEGESGWALAGTGYCYRRKSNNTAWFDPCRSWHTLAKDGDKNRKTWAHKQKGTAKSKSLWVLHNFEVDARPKPGTPTQLWLDWSPRADVDHGNCSSGTIGVDVNGFILEHTSQQCDKWDIDKGAAGGDFSNDWQGQARRSERDVAALKSTSTPNNTSPTNVVKYDYYAH